MHFILKKELHTAVESCYLNTTQCSEVGFLNTTTVKQEIVSFWMRRALAVMAAHRLCVKASCQGQEHPLLVFWLLPLLSPIFFWLKSIQPVTPLFTPLCTHWQLPPYENSITTLLFSIGSWKPYYLWFIAAQYCCQSSIDEKRRDVCDSKV